MIITYDNYIYNPYVPIKSSEFPASHTKEGVVTGSP